MTKREISKLLGYTFTFINYQFVIAERTNETLKLKKGKSNKVKTVDYSLQEVKDALVWATPMELQYLEEHFVYRDTFYEDKRDRKKPLPKDFLDFKFLYEHARLYPAVCATCGYCSARKMNHLGSKYHPYCSFYGSFLNKVKVKLNIFKDRCPTYLHSDKEPVIIIDGYPVNINNLNGKGEQKILGYEPNQLTSKKTEKGGVIYLLKEEEYDIFE